MLSFDKSHYVGVESAGLAIQPELDALISRLIAEGAQNLFFLGAGGVQILSQPAYELLSRHSTFPVFYEMGAELVVSGNVNLGDRSLAILTSVSGTTKEAVAAVEYAQAQGATVITFTGRRGTPLAQKADYNFTCEAADDTSSELYYLQTLLVALAVLKARGELDGCDRITSELANLPELLVGVKESFDGKGEEVARALAADNYHMIVGAGPTWAEAHYYSMCILEEMQWIRTRPVHASDFFHGAFELIEPGVSVILLKGEDETRELADRVERFAAEHTDKLIVLDSKSFDLPGLSEQTRSLVAPAVLAAALERVSVHLEVLRNHPLTTRRYYKKIDY